MIKNLIRCHKGMSLVEFAIALPVLVTLLLGITELARYAIIVQKTDKLVESMADLVTQGACVTAGDLTVIGSASRDIMAPFTFDGSIIFSSVAAFSAPPAACVDAATNQPCITWQIKQVYGNAATTNPPSKIGNPGSTTVNFPGGYNMIPGQNVITAEVYTTFEPIMDISKNFIPSIEPTQIYRVAIYKPRQGLLSEIKSNCDDD